MKAWFGFCCDGALLLFPLVYVVCCFRHGQNNKRKNNAMLPARPGMSAPHNTSIVIQLGNFSSYPFPGAPRFLQVFYRDQIVCMHSC